MFFATVGAGPPDGDRRRRARAARRRRSGSRGARSRAPVITKPTSLRVTPAAFCARSASRADEVAAVELHHPAEARLERRGLLVEVVAVERQPRLEAQRVARAQADRLAAGGAGRLEQRVPQRGGVLGVAEDLEAVLAGVAGAGDPDRHAGDRQRP